MFSHNLQSNKIEWDFHNASSIQAENLRPIGFTAKINQQEVMLLLKKYENDDMYINDLWTLGVCYLEGIYVAQSYRKAHKCFKLAAEADLPDAIYMLGEFFEYGYLKQSFAKAKQYYWFAAKKGSYRSLLRIGKYFMNRPWLKHYKKKSFQCFRLAAKWGSTRAQILLGRCYQIGFGVKESLDKAIIHYKIAAKNGDTDVYYYLNECLFLQKDYNESTYYLKSAALINYGNPKFKALCQLELGDRYRKGIGVGKSIKNAIFYYKLAAENNSWSAQTLMGEAYFYGLMGLKRDYKEAFYYYSLAANNQYTDAETCRILGSMYEKGLGVEKSLHKAKYYYDLARQIHS